MYLTLKSLARRFPSTSSGVSLNSQFINLYIIDEHVTSVIHSCWIFEIK